MRLHALGIPPTITNKEYSCCAFTNQLRLFCKFMSESGFEVIHYGHEHSEVNCSEHVSVVYDEEMKRNYGNDYKFNQRFFKHNVEDEIHKIFRERSYEGIQKRKSGFDIILCFWGMGHYELAAKLTNCVIVEPSVSYSKSFAPNRIFASYSIMNTHYTQENRDPSFWDTVIPHYIDPDEFLYSSDKSNYGLFLGRIIPSKGIGIILDLAKKLPDIDFVIAGNGNVDQNKLPNNVKFVGVVKGEEKKNLLTNAKFLIAPSLYNEPFGLIVPESLVSGTPVITTDWGGFVENNKHEHTGFRCRTFDQFVHAIKNIDKIKNEDCKNFALNNFSINCAKKRYIDYFKILENRYTKGYYYESEKFLNSTCEIVL